MGYGFAAGCTCASTAVLADDRKQTGPGTRKTTEKKERTRPYVVVSLCNAQYTRPAVSYEGQHHGESGQGVSRRGIVLCGSRSDLYDQYTAQGMV